MRAEFKECKWKTQAIKFFCESNFLLYASQGEIRRQEMRMYCLHAFMVCNQDYVSQSCNRIIPGSRKIKDSSTMYLSLLSDIHVLPKNIRNVKIVQLGIFHE